MKKKHFKVYIVITIIILIIGISIAYATLSQTLKVNSTTTIQSSKTSWNIVLREEECYVKAFVKKGTMEVDGRSVTISGFTLQAPSDYFSCWFSVENKGEVAAKISSINHPAPTIAGTGTSASADATLIRNNLIQDFSGLKEGDILKPDEERRCGIGFGLREEMTVLPTNPVTFTNAVYTINFEQA